MAGVVLDAFAVAEGKLVEAQRIEQRTRFDLEMLSEIGHCKGIENYTRHLSGSPPCRRPRRRPRPEQSRQIRIPATLAVMQAASAPPHIARKPRRATSARRPGAMAPMPPTWMAMELKLANPQSA